jgi:uncharacterized protein
MICKRILDHSFRFMENLVVTDVRMGLGYIAVENSSGGLGLAYTFRNHLPSRCCVFKDAGSLIGKSLKDIADLFFDHHNLLNAALGLAALNSVAKVGNLDNISGDVLEHLDITRDEPVLMIGHFAPVEMQLKKLTANLSVYDDKDNSDNNNSDAFLQIAKTSRVVLITSTTLINKTFENIIAKTPNARMRVLLGPSTPLFPDIFKNEGVHMLSGMTFEDNNKVKEIVSQGGGTMHFKKYAHKVNLLVNQDEKVML